MRIAGAEVLLAAKPLTDYFYPHNPVRKTYYPEDSRAYWNPNPKFYNRIKPRDGVILQEWDV
ncbi:MAG: hypothetical protein M1426_02500 [Patescibacteria group bacterium]|nr:hypothetical protein [Patescibacteria group bacterium]